MWFNRTKAKFTLFIYFVFSTAAMMPCDLSLAQEFEIDNSHSSVIFSISHYKIGYLYGRFNKCSGTVSLDRFNPAASSFKLKIESDSIDTNNEARDIALKGPDFLDVEQHEAIEFESESVNESDGAFRATGKLKINGEDREVTIPFKLLGSGTGPSGKSRIGMMSKFSIKRSDFGISEDMDIIGDNIAITFSFQGVRQ